MGNGVQHGKHGASVEWQPEKEQRNDVEEIAEIEEKVVVPLLLVGVPAVRKKHEEFLQGK